MENFSDKLISKPTPPNGVSETSKEGNGPFLLSAPSSKLEKPYPANNYGFKEPEVNKVYFKNPSRE